MGVTNRGEERQMTKLEYRAELDAMQLETVDELSDRRDAWADYLDNTLSNCAVESGRCLVRAIISTINVRIAHLVFTRCMSD